MEENEEKKDVAAEPAQTEQPETQTEQPAQTEAQPQPTEQPQTAQPTAQTAQPPPAATPAAATPAEPGNNAEPSPIVGNGGGGRMNEDFTEYRQRMADRRAAARAGQQAAKEAYGATRDQLLATGMYHVDTKGKLRLKKQYRGVSDDDGNAERLLNRNAQVAGAAAWERATQDLERSRVEKARAHADEIRKIDEEAKAERVKAREAKDVARAKGRLAVLDGVLSAQGNARDGKDGIVDPKALDAMNDRLKRLGLNYQVSGVMHDPKSGNTLVNITLEDGTKRAFTMSSREVYDMAADNYRAANKGVSDDAVHTFAEMYSNATYGRKDTQAYRKGEAEISALDAKGMKGLEARNKHEKELNDANVEMEKEKLDALDARHADELANNIAVAKLKQEGAKEINEANIAAEREKLDRLDAREKRQVLLNLLENTRDPKEKEDIRKELLKLSSGETGETGDTDKPELEPEVRPELWPQSPASAFKIKDLVGKYDGIKTEEDYAEFCWLIGDMLLQTRYYPTAIKKFQDSGIFGTATEEEIEHLVDLYIADSTSMDPSGYSRALTGLLQRGRDERKKGVSVPLQTPTQGAEQKPTQGAEQKPTNGAEQKPPNGAEQKPPNGEYSVVKDGKSYHWGKSKSGKYGYFPDK